MGAPTIFHDTSKVRFHQYKNAEFDLRHRLRLERHCDMAHASCPEESPASSDQRYVHKFFDSPEEFRLALQLGQWKVGSLSKSHTDAPVARTLGIWDSSPKAELLTQKIIPVPFLRAAKTPWERKWTKDWPSNTTTFRKSPKYCFVVLTLSSTIQ